MLFSALMLASQLTSAALVEIPPFETRVTDLTNTLSISEKAAFEAKLQSYQEIKGNRIVVLIVPSTQPEAIEQYAIRVTDTWELVREGVDDGVLLLIAKDDRAVRIEVGYGLEGVVTDLYAKRIINETITPRFKQGDFAGGIDGALNSLINLVNGESLPAPSKNNFNRSQLEEIFPLLLFGCIISGMFLRAIFGTFVGSALNGGLMAAIVFFIGWTMLGAGVLGVIAFIFTLISNGRGSGSYGGSSTSGGGFSSGGFSGGGLSGGGFSSGGFGGGGASGSW